jgi:DNA invertase Pin-like site-specific DNA recombinase
MPGSVVPWGRDQRPAFDAMLKDAVRQPFNILLVWSIDRLTPSASGHQG